MKLLDLVFLINDDELAKKLEKLKIFYQFLKID